MVYTEVKHYESTTRNYTTNNLFNLSPKHPRFQYKYSVSMAVKHIENDDCWGSALPAISFPIKKIKINER